MFLVIASVLKLQIYTSSHSDRVVMNSFCKATVMNYKKKKKKDSLATSDGDNLALQLVTHPTYCR